MLRIMLTYVIPFLLPTILYFAWVFATQRRAAASGGGAQAQAWQDVPWVWLIGAGIILMALSLAATALFGGDQPGGVYEPARLIDGRIEPGQVTR
jgi:hypothetical protein